MKKNINILMLALLVFAGCLTGCEEEYYFDGGLSDGKLGMSTYDFIVSRPDAFDTLQWVIDQHDLKELVNSENSTFFLPQDGAFELFFKKLEMDPVPKSLEELPVSVKDTLGLLVRKYMIADKVMRDDVPRGRKTGL